MGGRCGGVKDSGDFLVGRLQTQMQKDSSAVAASWRLKCNRTPAAIGVRSNVPLLKNPPAAPSATVKDSGDFLVGRLQTQMQKDSSAVAASWRLKCNRTPNIEHVGTSFYFYQ